MTTNLTVLEGVAHDAFRLAEWFRECAEERARYLTAQQGGAFPVRDVTADQLAMLADVTVRLAEVARTTNSHQGAGT